MAASSDSRVLVPLANGKRCYMPPAMARALLSPKREAEAAPVARPASPYNRLRDLLEDCLESGSPLPSVITLRQMIGLKTGDDLCDVFNSLADDGLLQWQSGRANGKFHYAVLMATGEAVTTLDCPRELIP